MHSKIPTTRIRKRVVSSIFGNIERLLDFRTPRSARVLLGARWSFGLPLTRRRDQLYEYSLPLNPVHFLDVLAARTGVVVEHHPASESCGLYEYLRDGKAAIVAVDSFFLPYRPAFMRVHSNRTIVIEQTYDPTRVRVEDLWPPSHTGQLLVSDLERARHSSVLRIPHLEPVFSGHPIDGEWFSVEVNPVHFADPQGWGIELLSTLLKEARTSTQSADVIFGLEAVRHLVREFSSCDCGNLEQRELRFQQASLLLRAELSSRVYLCSLLQACATWMHDPIADRAIFRYSASLSNLEMSRDMLIKAMRRESIPIYRACIAEGLTAFLAAEERLLQILQRQLERVLAPSRMQQFNILASDKEISMPKYFDMSNTNISARDPYGLVTHEIFTNPHPLYHMLRYSEPVHWSDILNAWILTRYDDVIAAFKDPRLSNALRRGTGTAKLPEEMQKKMAPIDRVLLLWVLNMDDPEHHRLRVLLSKAFTPQAIDKMQGRIVAIADELLDAVLATGKMDFVMQYAYPLPVRVIADMFGVPEEEQYLLTGWSKHISTFFAVGPAKEEVLDNMNTAVREMTDYLRGVVNANRGNPQDNILGSLIRAEERGDVLSEDQLLATCLMILFAGHDSTVNLIGSGMFSLLRFPDQLARLKANPSLIHTAVDEFLRYESPVMRHDRVAREEFELHGKKIRAGQRVILGLGAANRDPTRFRNPDQLDIGRKDGNRHTTFGHGPHACLGAILACSQAEIAILRALERLPNLRLGAQPPKWREHFNFRGLSTLPLEFDPVASHQTESNTSEPTDIEASVPAA